MTNKTNVMNIDTIERQQQYVDRLRESGHGLGIVFADAFLRGMRDLGYKNPAWALAEQIDNAFQAAADTVAIRFGYDDSNKTGVRPDQIAICDNGNGMIPEMISYAVRWGGTDREGDRFGFGRYGYGLPSSAVSIARRYTVYSKTAAGKWHGVSVDIGELGKSAGDVAQTERLLKAKPLEPPAWVLKGTRKDTLDLASTKSGTIIVLEDLDRLRTQGGWIKSDSLRSKLLKQFGVIYRYWIPERTLFVDGERTVPVDPLFLMEHARFYDENSFKAERVETRTFEVETSRGTTGTVTIRAAVLPPTFQLVDPTTYRYGLGNARSKPNSRHEVMRDYNGLLITRERRHIDTIQPRWTKFQNYDYNLKIEIDFDPELDEFFGITTSKQQIEIADEMWDKLQSNGKNNGALVDLVHDMRARFKALQSELDARYRNEKPEGQESDVRPSVAAMQETEKFHGTVTEPTASQKQEGDKNLEEAATQVATVSGESKEVVLQRLKERVAKNRFEIEFKAIPDGPFYRPTRLGEQKRVIINSDHPFYAKVYAAAPEISAALEVLLFVLAERELEVKNEAESFYKAERQRWSERLRFALDSLTADESMVNKASAVAEQMHMAAESGTN